MRKFIPHVLIGFLLGGLVIATGSYVSARWNDAVVLNDLQAVVTIRTQGHERWLGISYHIIHQRACPSWSEHMLFRDNWISVREGDKLVRRLQRNYVLLAISANGIGDDSTISYFAISLRLPDPLEPGKWYYTVATSSSCEWLPGLTREDMSHTTPVPVEIPR